MDDAVRCDRDPEMCVEQREVIRLLCENLACGDLFTQVTALKGLAKLAGRSHSEVMATMKALLAHRKVATRRLAMESLHQVAAVGDPVAISCCCRALRDRDAQVRQRAAQALGLLAPAGHLEAIEELLRSVLEDQEKLTRRCAVIALGQLVLEADGQAG